MFLRQCLRKEPGDRLHDIADMRLALTGRYDAAAAMPASSLSAGGSSVSTRAVASRAGWIVAAIAGFAVLAIGIAWWNASDELLEADLANTGLLATIGDLQARLREPMLTVHQLSYRHGTIGGARFASDEQEIIFGAALDDEPYRIFRTRRDSFQPRLMAEAPPADLFAISQNNQLALAMGRPPANGFWPQESLAEMDLYGGAPRPIDNGNIQSLDYGPDGTPATLVRKAGDQWVLEFPIGTPVHRSAFRISPVRVSPDGSRVCFIDEYSRLMTLEAGAGADVLLDDLSRAARCAWSPNGVEVLYDDASPAFATHYSLAAVRTDGRGRRTLGAYASYIEVHDVAADGAILVEAGRLRYSALGQQSGDSRVRNLSVFDASRARSLNASGSHLLIYDNSLGAGAERLFLRPMDGSSYQQLSNRGSVILAALSNDASLVAVLGDGVSTPIPPDMLTLFSVESGTRETVQLDVTTAVVNNGQGTHAWADQHVEFSDDNRRLLLPNARKGDELPRAWVYDFGERRSYAVTPQGVTGPVILSPDGNFVASNEADGLYVYEVATRDRRRVADTDPGMLSRWTDDGNVVLLIEPNGAGATVVERDLDTGQRLVRREIRAADEAGITLLDLYLARDGETYAYSAYRSLTDLYLLEGYVEPDAGDERSP